jgi:hypothetical protein
MRRQIEAAPVAAALGALLLLVSLFLDWYEPGVSAFTTFEVLDLLLVALALAATAVAAERFSGAVAGQSGDGAFDPSLLPALGGVALLIVLSQVLNHPPAAIGRDAEAGQWLALAGAALIAAGGVLGVTRISLAVNVDRRAGGEAEPEEPAAAPPEPSPSTTRSPSAEAREAEPEVHDELYPEPERRGPIGVDDPETRPPGGPAGDESSPAGSGSVPGREQRHDRPPAP